MVFHIQKYFRMFIVGMAFFFVCLFIKITRDKRESRPSVQILCHCKSCHGLFFVKEVFLEEIAKNVNLLIFGQNI